MFTIYDACVCVIISQAVVSQLIMSQNLAFKAFLRGRINNESITNKVNSDWFPMKLFKALYILFVDKYITSAYHHGCEGKALQDAQSQSQSQR